MVKERNYTVQVGGWTQSTMLMSMFIIPDDYFFLLYHSRRLERIDVR